MADTQRERLIELIYSANEKFTDENITDEESVKILADYLLEHSVIVPPCKVGDTVYRVYSRYTKCSESEQRFDEYSCQGCECLECDSHKEYYVEPQKAYSLDWILANFHSFDKTIFLTPEDAERAVKEREET